MERPDRPPHFYPDDAPFPSGGKQGFIYEEYGKHKRWGWRFLKTPESTQWFCTFLDQYGGDSTLFGRGATPGAAFDSMIARWEIANGGPPVEVARRTLTEYREAMIRSGWFEEKVDYGEETE